MKKGIGMTLIVLGALLFVWPILYGFLFQVLLNFFSESQLQAIGGWALAWVFYGAVPSAIVFLIGIVLFNSKKKTDLISK